VIFPSIDLQGGAAVQLVGGDEKKIDAGDPRPIARHFGLVGEIAVIDLDAAKGTGSNAELIEELIDIAPCRVGGGIRDVETAIRWLDRGAEKIILGTAATPEILRELPRERVIAAVDSRDDRVVVEGWTSETEANVADRIDALRGYVGGFLVTFVEREGRMQGLPEDRVRAIVQRAGDARVTVAGGVRDPGDIARADRAGADTQVGMALYSDAFDLAEGFCAPLTSDRIDALFPTVVTDARGHTLGLVYSSVESIRESLRTRAGVYYSRSRGALWRKGESSGDTQELVRIGADCDRDALRFIVRQSGKGFCHTGSATCFGDVRGLGALEATLRERLEYAPEGSYTKRLLSDPDLLRGKLLEEAAELAEARDAGEASWEAADVIYFALVAAIRRGASLESIERELDRRALKVSRRKGDAKPSSFSVHGDESRADER